MRHDISQYRDIPYLEKKAIKRERSLRVLQFLADGHAYTTADTIEELLGIARSVARRLLESLADGGALSSRLVEIIRESGVPRPARIFGITGRGLAWVNAPIDVKSFSLGSINPSYVPHRLLGQRICIAASKHGWRAWATELTLRRQATKNAKIPDAIGLDPTGKKIAIEVERNPKTLARYRRIVTHYRSQIRDGEIDGVAYICSPGTGRRIERLITAAGGSKAFTVFEPEGWPHTPIPRTIHEAEKRASSELQAGLADEDDEWDGTAEGEFRVGFASGRYYALRGDEVLLESFRAQDCYQFLEQLGVDTELMPITNWLPVY